MLNVLLVDDEALARTGLRYSFEWEAHGFRLAGEASNGQKALPYIERGDIDILITDIYMPVMDGLELTKITRSVSPSTKIVLLSSYSDFAYAREGIRLGASDYLLKPTLEAENLIEVLRRLADELAQEKEREAMLRQDQVIQIRRMREEKQLLRWIRGETEDDPNAAGGKAPEADGQFRGSRLVVCSLVMAGRKPDNRVFLEFALEEAAELFYCCSDGICARYPSNQLVMLIPDEGPDPDFHARLSRIHAGLERLERTVTLGVSLPVKEAAALPEAYKQAVTAVRRGFFEAYGNIYAYTPLFELKREFSTDYFRKLKDILRRYLEDGFREKAAATLEEIAGYWTFEQRTPEEVLREAQEVLYVCHPFNPEAIRPAERLDRLDLLNTAEEVKSWMVEVFESVRQTEKPPEAGSGQKEDRERYKQVIDSALAYLSDHFSGSITLGDVARHVNMSKNYFSEIFKRETGQSFIDYLIQLRLGHARHLLKTTSLKVFEVAERSGFSDVKYFSRLFKKMMNCSPSEFRE
ncbi:helix-turn-helix domain-containing protein [Paenibacillus humicola]|uniref:response regulator transcription factor n=1 Tax=Paenibacillus humicola TaxID=3110540 RepID=UPI00237C4DB8|nr:helix-turn-helix domain-containing protein [Paenibacillus humicola]